VDAAQYREDIDAAIQFLEGKNRSVINAFVKRMEEAAAHREYERAARYRDQIGRLKEIESQQLVSRHAPRDLDVVASASRPGMHCITVLFIRNGAILGSRNHFPKLAGEASKGAIMSGFLSQYYLGREAPPEIVVDAAVEDRDLLEAEFAKRARRTVSIRPNVRGRRARWLTLAATNAMQGLSMKVASNATLQRQFGALGQALNMEASPERLECFDISHTSGEATVASCVVFNQSGPLKSDYRRFNLKPTSAGDDYAAMKEALGRRYARVRKGEVPMPDVLFVDGGKGQLAQAMTVLDELEIDWLQVVAVAKGRARRPGTEQLFLAGQNTPLILPADSPALHLVQQIRDEAHRFAITGHRRQRGKARTTSRLEQIPGLGPKRRRELLRQFGGLHGVSAASMDDLAKVHGISKALAERIYDDLHLEGQN
ncbi:MAG TPA: excinuclease ABC subunit UvrC, partial [Woeseiaceae bacterium]|nr:excinuclease ABC subunit UvrC [Woeseiaceae bacterium]